MKEYLTELREFHRVGDGSGSRQISVGDVVTVHQDKCPRQKWNIGLVKRTYSGADGRVRSAEVKVARAGAKPVTLRRPVQKLFPMELRLEKEDQQGPQIQFVDDADVVNVVHT